MTLKVGVSHHFVKLLAYRSSESGNIRPLICQVTSKSYFFQDYVILWVKPLILNNYNYSLVASDIVVVVEI